ncbi:cation:proton antiporter [Micromonospora olivasterospora]|uniref:ForY n=1 Tax=Micromonospora olivasterospora TaxID=1880 RepID=Q2MG15_MICOL|nr:cation:proton antiporter [Micromonospora olivasterospora]TWH67125.1 Kef-type K+ transport system membrane component KefB [Micromonospora olivasterospora]CAF31532.1 ForY [Micromonospora olivasterospora]
MEATVVQVVLAVAVITALSYLLGLVARRLGQPAVIGQMFAGIALGPSVLGQLPGDLGKALFPMAIRPYLTVVAQLALVLFLFYVGYELNRGLLRQRVQAVPLVAAAAFVVPMLLGAGSTVAFADWYAATGTPEVPHGAFVLYVAVALSITAVPVLAGIINERGLAGAMTGVVALTSAGVIDALGWLALTAAMLHGKVGGQRPWSVTLLLLLAYLLVMVVVARPALGWLRRQALASGRSAASLLPVAATFAMASAWATGAMGLHVILGAFIAGLIMPRGETGHPDPALLTAVEKAGSVLLPVFFVVSGLSTDLGALHAADLGLLVVICVAATAGKLGGGSLAARVSGLSWRESTNIGVMLNTRGLTELVVLNVGLQAGFVNGRLYTVFVLMALLTTAATGPLLTLLARRDPAPKAPELVARRRVGRSGDVHGPKVTERTVE